MSAPRGTEKGLRPRTFEEAACLGSLLLWATVVALAVGVAGGGIVACVIAGTGCLTQTGFAVWWWFERTNPSDGNAATESGVKLHLPPDAASRSIPPGCAHCGQTLPHVGSSWREAGACQQAERVTSPEQPRVCGQPYRDRDGDMDTCSFLYGHDGSCW